MESIFGGIRCQRFRRRQGGDSAGREAGTVRDFAAEEAISRALRERSHNWHVAALA